MNAVDEAFVREHTVDFEAARASALEAPWETLEAGCGATRDDMRRFAQLLVDRPNAIFVWSMGLAQHAHGVKNVQALINVGLARGLTGRPNRGLMPIRGHSGVQGGAEVGCTPGVDAATAERWSRVWGFPVPAGKGMAATEMIAAAAAGDLDVFWMVGGNFLETLADVPRSAAALERPRLRVHQDIVLTSATLVDPSEDVLVLPATTRYESPGGGTETSTERRIIYSPEIPGRRIGSARPEWQVMTELAARVRPEAADRIRVRDAAAIRQEIARAVPLYAGIERLEKQGDQMQWGGPHLFADGQYATADGKAHFTAQTPRSLTPRPGEFRVSTRRGKQFNSMVQKDVDPLTGAGRHDILISEADARQLGIADGGTMRLISDFGEYTGRARLADIKPGNLEVHWPEGAGLLSAEELDPDSLGPDYNADARVEVLRA